MEDCQFQINMFKTGNFFNVLGNFRFFIGNNLFCLFSAIIEFTFRNMNFCKY